LFFDTHLELVLLVSKHIVIEIEAHHLVNMFQHIPDFFQHSKTDSLGEESKYPRHLYANPLVPCICPMLSLTLYFSSCFNCAVTADNYVFPERNQEEWFSKILQWLLAQHEEELMELGYPLQHIGTHSIWKGAVSYLSAVPGGLQTAVVCIHAGWIMVR